MEILTADDVQITAVRCIGVIIICQCNNLREVLEVCGGGITIQCMHYIVLIDIVPVEPSSRGTLKIITSSFL